MKKIKNRTSLNVDQDFFLKACEFISKNENKDYPGSHAQPLARIDISKSGIISYKVLNSVIDRMKENSIEIDHIRRLIEKVEQQPTQAKLIQVKNNER